MKPSENNPITWPGLIDLIKRVGAVCVAFVAICAAWVAVGGPIPATHDDLIETARLFDQQISQTLADNVEQDRYASETRLLLLYVQKSLALSELAELRERKLNGEHSSDIRKLMLSLEAQIDKIERQAAKIERSSGQGY